MIAGAGGCGSATWTRARFVFLDETGASTNMIRRYGRCPRGERLVDAAPWGHWKITTFVAGLRSSGIIAPLVLDGPMTGEVFRAYVEQMLAPALSARRRSGDGQPRRPQGRWCARGDPSRRGERPLSAALQPRP